MYPDQKRLRDNRVTVRFDDYEHDLITALANYQNDRNDDRCPKSEKPNAAH
jgi:hypothetical protein